MGIVSSSSQEEETLHRPSDPEKDPNAAESTADATPKAVTIQFQSQAAIASGLCGRLRVDTGGQRKADCTLYSGPLATLPAPACLDNFLKVRDTLEQRI